MMDIDLLPIIIDDIKGAIPINDVYHFDVEDGDSFTKFEYNGAVYFVHLNEDGKLSVLRRINSCLEQRLCETHVADPNMRSALINSINQKVSIWARMKSIYFAAKIFLKQANK